MTRQTADNWRGEGCQNYDDSQDVCLDDEVVEAGHRMNLAPTGNARGRVKQRKAQDVKVWVETNLLTLVQDLYKNWRARGGKEPSLSTGYLREFLLEGVGGVPEDFKWMRPKDQDAMVALALKRLETKGDIESSTGVNERGQEARMWNPVTKASATAALLFALADYFDPEPVVAEFKTPHDAWKGLKPGIQPLPQPMEGHEKAWLKIATRLGFDAAKGVMQLAPVIGGRRRYHHRPLSSWLLPDKKTTLTLTTDKMEAQAWNRLKSNKNVAMPRIHDVFELLLSGKKDKPIWAIVHERLTWPVDPDWDLFIDSFFRWRAMQKDALKPAQPEDLEGFLRFIIDPKVSDPVTTRRKRIETALPFKMMNDRRADIASRRKGVWQDRGLDAKIAWAKSTLKFLRTHKIKHRDLDPSNLAKTLKGRTVVTNIAESRSRGGKSGRLGRVSSAAEPIEHDPFGPSPAAAPLRTAQAINMLLDPEAPLMEQLHILSTETRLLTNQIHQDDAMRAAVQEAAFQIGYPQETVLKGVEKLTDLAEKAGGKAVKLAEAVMEKVAPNMSLPPPPGTTPAVSAAGWRNVKTPEERSQAAQKAAKTRKARQVPVEVKVNGKVIAGAYYPSYNDKVDEESIYFTSRNALKKLGDLPMVRAYKYTDDYYGDAQENYGKGEGATLADLLAQKPRSVYLRFYRPGQKYDDTKGWVLNVGIHQNEMWNSSEPLTVATRKTEAPAPVELPPMPRAMEASFSGRKKAKRREKVKEVVDALVNVAEYLEEP